MLYNQKHNLWHYKAYVIRVYHLGDGYYEACRVSTGQHLVTRILRFFGDDEVVRKLVDRLEIYEGQKPALILTGDITSFEGKQDFSFTGISFKDN